MRRDPTLSPLERDRVEMLFLSDRGWSPPAIGTHLGYCAATVRRTFNRFNHSGPAGLRQQRPGPPPDEPHRQRVARALSALLKQERTLRRAQGRLWTAAQLAQALREQDIHLSTRQTRRYLKEQGARWRRVVRSLQHKQDPKLVAQAREELTAFKKRPSQGS